jgi:hypothetical protein
MSEVAELRPYRITMTQNDGFDVSMAQWDGRTFSVAARSTGGGTALALARQLIAAGAPDGGWEAFGIDGRPLMYGDSLYQLARHKAATPRLRPAETV